MEQTLERKAGPVDRLATAFATLGGVGYLPAVPGTWGSLATLPLCWLVALPGSPVLYAAVILGVTALGIPAAGVAERVLRTKDAKPVVIDEVAGMLLTLFLVPITPLTLAAGFFLFRVFDVLKVFPANRLEHLGGGTGIVADDLMAGVYANVVLQIGLWSWAS